MKIKTFPLTHKIHSFLWSFFCLATSIGVFVLILQNHQPRIVREISIASRIDFFPIIPLITMAIYLCFRIPGRLGQLTTLSATMLLFALPLAGLWASGHTQTSVISGLIQLNDASGYYIDAIRLTNGMNFSFFSSRRPLFPGFLSILLVATNYNLMAALAILSAITAFSCYLLVQEVQKTHGRQTAVFLLIMLFLYYRLHSGISMSENFGIALGSLGFALLWRSVRGRNLRLIWLGIFTTTIALNARAGAFFELPFLVLWAGLLFYEKKTIPWKPVALAFTAIMLGFASNLMLGRIIGRPDGIPFANFSYSLYSLAEGGKSWAYIAESHPEVLLIPEPERTIKIFQLAFELIKNKPDQAISGAIFFWKAIFTDTLYNVFAFVAKENWVISPPVKWLLYILSSAGIFFGLKNKRDPFSSLINLCILGIFLSIPLAPPTDSFRMRPYAASIAMICILPAYGFGSLLSKSANIFHIKKADYESSFSGITPTATVLLLTLALTGPLIVRFVATKPHVTLQDCGLNVDRVIVQVAKGTYINIKKNRVEFLDWPPNYHVYLFRKNSHGIENENLINWLEKVPAPQTILVAFDIITGKGVLISTPIQIITETPIYYQICGKYEKDPLLKSYYIFYGTKILPAE